MLGYRVFFKNSEGHIKAREEFYADDDLCALERAQELLSQQSHACPGFELWQEKRRVCGNLNSNQKRSDDSDADHALR